MTILLHQIVLSFLCSGPHAPLLMPQQLTVSSSSEKVTIAEMLWACKVADSNYSLASCEGIETLKRFSFNPLLIQPITTLLHFQKG